MSNAEMYEIGRAAFTASGIFLYGVGVAFPIAGRAILIAAGSAIIGAMLG